MRSGSIEWSSLANEDSRELVLVVKVHYATPLYITSASVDGLSGRVLSGLLSDVSSQSQKINPEQGRSEIGSIKFDVTDEAGVFTAELKSELDGGAGIKGKKVELFSGFAGLSFDHYRLEQTQIVDKDVSIDNGVVSVSCADVQRTLRQNIFNKAQTVLTQSATSDDTTIYCASTANFEPLAHFTSNSAANSGSYYYFTIKYNDGIEVVRATGKTATSFTGCERGFFQTSAREHLLEESDEGVKIEEWVYLELPAPAMAYALMTGKLITPTGTHAAMLPDGWHLGIDEQYVDIQAFRNIGSDWFVPGDYSKGKILRFDNPKAQDGKKFIEKQIMLLLGAFMPIRADGAISLKRMTGVLSTAAYSQVLDESVVVKYSSIKSDLSRVSNSFMLEWAYFTGEDNKPVYLRKNRLVDAGSVARHGLGKEQTLRFEGLHNARHTFGTIKDSFDALRDRYAGPPLTLKLDLLPNLTSVEVGDVVRVKLANVTDPITGESLDRSFEVQSIGIDQNSGKLSVSLFGSSERADAIEDVGADVSAELPDSWYSAVGINLSSVVSIDGSGFVQADASIDGATDQHTIYYHAGDLTIPSGRTITTSENVEIRVRGVLTINGQIKTDSTNRYAGFLGTTVGGKGTSNGSTGPTKYWRGSRAQPYDFQNATTLEGYHSAFPQISVINNAGELEGLPEDQRGSGGGDGADAIAFNQVDDLWDTVAAGGIGGFAGGGIRIIARGIAFGSTGKIDTSGDDGTPGTVGPLGVGGSGDGGAPGGVLLLVDGNQNPFPILTDKTIPARFGISPNPVPGAHPADDQGLGQLMGSAAARALFVPTSRTAYPEYSAAKVVRGSQVFQQDDEPTNADARSLAGRKLKRGDVWFNSSDRNRQHTYNGSAWEAGAVTITKDDVTASGVAASDIGGETPSGAQSRADAAEQAAKAYTDQNFVDAVTYGTDIAAIQAQVDGSITNWFYDGVPTLANAPASTWTTNAIKDTHLGDTYYDNNTGYAYRFLEDGSSYKWQLIANSDITQALAAAATAQDTADSKRRVFVTTPTVPYDNGDLWDTGSGIKRATASKSAAQSYDSADWQLISDVTNYSSPLINNEELAADPRVNNRRFQLSGGRLQFLNEGDQLEDFGGVTRFDIGAASDSEFLIEKRRSVAVNRRGMKRERVDRNALVASSGEVMTARLRQARQNFEVKRSDEKAEEAVVFAESIAAEKAQEAQSAAALVAQEQASLARTQANAYADGKVTAEEQRAIAQAELDLAASKAYADARKVEANAYADGIVTQAEQDAIDAANSYADAQAALAETNANAYADGVADAAELAAISAAEAYADARKVEANAYADGIVTTAEQAAIDASNAYADAQANAAEVTSKAYADGIVTQAEQDAIDAANAAAAQAEANAIAASDAVGSASAAEQVAKTYAAQQAASARSGALADAVADSRTANSAVSLSGLGFLGDTNANYVSNSTIDGRADSRIDSLRPDSWAETLADARVGALRPDSNYRNSNTSAADVGLPNVVDGADITDYSDSRISNTQALVLARLDEDLRNSAFTFNSNGELKRNGALVGKATLGGLGFSGDANANYVSNSTIDGRADSRIGSLRPDSSYKNSNVTKSSVGLGSVENKSSASIRAEITKTNLLNTGLSVSDVGGLTPSGVKSTTRADQKSIPQVLSGGLGSQVNVVPISATDAGSTARISVASHTRYYGGFNVGLNSGLISGLNFNTPYYVYYDDASYSGGSVSYFATTNKYTAASGIGRVYVGKITTPSNGGAGTPPPDIDDLR
jgi:hypothetical protein